MDLRAVRSVLDGSSQLIAGLGDDAAAVDTFGNKGVPVNACRDSGQCAQDDHLAGRPGGQMIQHQIDTEIDDAHNRNMGRPAEGRLRVKH